MDHLAELRVESAKANAIDWMQKQLAEEREMRRSKQWKRSRCTKRWDSWNIGDWSAEIEDSHAVINSLLAQSLHDQMDAFSAEATKIATPAHGVNGGPEASAPDSSNFQAGPDPHQVRIAGKALRYTLEMADAAGHALPSKVFKSFNPCRMPWAPGTIMSC